MIVHTDSTDSISQHSTGIDTGTGAHGDRVRTTRSDAECRARACEFLTELVVIAARDDDHQTVVLTVEDWDAVRRASSGQRRDLLDACSIHDHDQLLTALLARQPRSWSLNIAA